MNAGGDRAAPWWQVSSRLSSQMKVGTIFRSSRQIDSLSPGAGRSIGRVRGQILSGEGPSHSHLGCVLINRTCWGVLIDVGYAPIVTKTLRRIEMLRWVRSELLGYREGILARRTTPGSKLKVPAL